MTTYTDSTVYDLVDQLVELAEWHREVADQIFSAAAALESAERQRHRDPRRPLPAHVLPEQSNINLGGSPR